VAADQHDHPGGHDGEPPAQHEHPALPPPPLAPGDPGPAAREEVDPQVGAGFIPEGPGRVLLEPDENPGPEASFGFVDRFVRLSEEGGAFQPGTLVVEIDSEHVEGVAPDTVRAFRWSDEQAGFELVERSGLGQTGDYVWARVSEPGRYGLIGVSTDPLVARTLAVLAVLEDLTGLDGLGAAELLGSRICQLILCLPGLRERMGEPEFAQAFIEANVRLGLPAAWGPTGVPGAGRPPPGDPCEKCLGLRLDLPRLPRKVAHPPEVELLPQIQLPRPRDIGRWDGLTVVPAAAATVLAVHAALLRTGKILYFGGDEAVKSQNEAGGAAIDNTRVFDPQTGVIDVVGSPPNYDLFCCGHALLPDGRLLAAGGTKTFQRTSGRHVDHFEGLRNSAIFDPGAPAGTNPWTTGPLLNRERGKTTGGGAWYPTLVTLPDGRVLRVAGHPEDEDSPHNNLMLETFDPATSTWADEGAGADLPDAGEGSLYPRLHVLPDGHLFCATPLSGPPTGPTGHSWKWNLTTKAWTSVGSGPGPEYQEYSTTSVLLPLVPAANYRARVLVMNPEQPKTIDLDAPSPTWQPTTARTLRLPDTGRPPTRYHATAVLLPDASVLLVGGLKEEWGYGSPPVLTAERFDPATGGWATMATATVPRVYHSVALLLPDGRVWTGGSDYGNGHHEPRMEVYSPPYLFRGPRPVIAGAPGTITIPGSFAISSPEAPRIRTVCLLRCGSSTHAFNSDQRYVGLVIQSQAPTQLTVASPPNTRVAPPGYYLLFILDDFGLPSVGRFVRVE
jgi:hypothetical protein